MAQLKSTNILGNLAISGDTLSSKFIKLGGTNSELLRADGSAAMLSSAEISQVLGYTPAGNTGANASGTWGISISGNAATATTCTGNAATADEADQVSQALTFSTGGQGGTNGTTYNGSTARTISYNSVGAAPTAHASTATTYGAASASNYGHAMASSTTPKANGTASVGSETAKFARGDHVHPLQTTISGNAATATRATNADNGIYYVEGNTDGTAGTWTGSNTNIPSLFTGLTIAYKIGIKGASTTTLTLTTAAGESGAKTVKRNNGALTTHVPVDSVIHLTYDGTYWQWADYDSNTYTSAFCTTAAGTAAKTASCSNYTLTSNSFIHVLMRYANSKAGAITLNINSTGAKPIYINGSASSASNYTLPAGTYLVYYNGTNYYFRTDGKLTASITGDAATLGGQNGAYYLNYENLTEVPSTFNPPLATSSVRGGMKIGFTATENNRPVLLSSEKAYISLPTRLVDYRTTSTAPDSATASGFYYTSNLPASLGFQSNQGTMFVSSYDADWVAQMVIGCYTDKLAFRKKGTDWTNWKIVATEDQLGNYLPLAGGTMTGIITSSYNSGTWLNSVNHKSAINLTGTSYVGWINGPSKNGRLVISSYPNSNDRLYFGYASNATISAGTNALDNSMSWEGSSGTLFAKKFAMAQGDNGKAAWQYNSATDCIELTWY